MLMWQEILNHSFWINLYRYMPCLLKQMCRMNIWKKPGLIALCENLSFGDHRSWVRVATTNQQGASSMEPAKHLTVTVSNFRSVQSRLARI